MTGAGAPAGWPAPETTMTLAPTARRDGGAPWWVRILVKLVLARLPVPHAWWRRVGIFRHGATGEDAARRGDAFCYQFHNYRRLFPQPPRRVVELGPGDSIACALWAKAYGAEQIWLIDVGRFALDRPDHYRAACEEIARRGLAPPALPPPGNLTAVQAATGAIYRTDGLPALRDLDDDSIDFMFSQAVLEHIRRGEFDDFLRQSFRALRPGGVASHAIDLGDHLGGALNHLRWPEGLWEHPILTRSGFYTNRLRIAEICRKAAAAGFLLSIPHLARWAALPTPRTALDAAFRDLPDAELCVASFTLVLQKPKAASP